MENQAKQNYINGAVVLLILVGIAWGIYINKRFNQYEQDAKVKTVIVKQVETINKDSIATLIEARYQDSLSNMRRGLESQLKQIKTENYVYRKKNKALRDSFENIYIDRPEF